MATVLTVGDAVEVLFSNQWFPARIEEIYNNDEYGLSYRKFDVSIDYLCQPEKPFSDGIYPLIIPANIWH